MRFANGPYQLPELTATYDPDVVVAMIGGNDLIAKISQDLLEAKWRTDIARLRATNDDVSVVLVPYPQTWVAGVPEYNERLGQIASSHDTARSRVVLADMPVFDWRVDTYDFAHLTATGERKIASVVTKALADVGVGTGTTHYLNPAVGMTGAVADAGTSTGWAPQPRVTVQGTSVTVSWDPVSYSSSQSILVRDLATGRSAALHGVTGTTKTLPGKAGGRYRIWLAPAKGYVALGTYSVPVDVAIPADVHYGANSPADVG
jgi:hypothetical protein